MGKSIFGAAPTDEVALIREARQLIPKFSGRIPSSVDLRELGKEYGNDLAAAVFAECIRATPPHAKFIRDVDATDLEGPIPPSKAGKAHLLVVPALGYERYRYAGGDGGMVIEAAKYLGMHAELVRTSCGATIDENAKILADALARIDGDGPVWIASISKAALEVRHFLETHPHLIREKNVAGWLSICGMPNGASVVERFRARLGPITFRLSALIAGLPMELVRQLCSDHKFWERGLSVPKDLIVINVVAVPLLWHMQRSGIIRRYKLLADWGPNDGTVLIGDSPALPGLIYPVWGADHYMRDPGLSFLIHKILRFALDDTAKQEPSQNQDSAQIVPVQ